MFVKGDDLVVLIVNVQALPSYADDTWLRSQQPIAKEGVHRLYILPC